MVHCGQFIHNRAVLCTNVYLIILQAMPPSWVTLLCYCCRGIDTRKGADYEALQHFQKPMNIKSGPDVGMVIPTDSYYKGAMNVDYFLHLRGAISLHL